MTNDPKKLEDCRLIYLDQNGRDHARIERRMRALGHRFNRRTLYNRGDALGWIAANNWRSLVKGERIKAEGESKEPCESPRVSKGDIGTQQEDVSRKAAKTQSGDEHRNDPATWNLEPEIPPVPANSAPPSALPSFSTFESFLRSAGGGMEWDKRHHQKLCYYLRRITEGKSKRLMIFMPPRHGKSETVTTRYAAWRLWHDPKMRVVVGSYNQHLANKFSRSIRRVLSEEEDKYIGGVSVPACVSPQGENSRPARRDNGTSQTRNPEPGMPASGRRIFPRSRAVNTMSEWETAHGGGVKAVGVGAGITGFGADLLIIDDPVKSTSQAHSKAFREKTWRWFRDDISTRLEPGAPMILIQTRWHEDDLAGRLLKKMQEGGEHWDVLKMPALVRKDKGERIKAKGESPRCESPRVSKGDIATEKEDISRKAAKTQSGPGNAGAVACMSDSEDTGSEEASYKVSAWDPASPADDLLALWPERYPVEELLKIKESIGSYMFNALYQQNPSPEEGGIFKRPWFKHIVDTVPPGLEWCRGYDLAVSTRTTADFTASFRVAKDAAGNFYIADGYRGRLEFPDQRRYVLERMRSEPSTLHGIEAALHGQALVQDIGREPGIANIPLKSVEVDRDKMTRALAWAAPAEAGKVILVRGAWIDAFIEELASFPTGAHDDQIDAVSLAFRLIADRELEKAKVIMKHRSQGF